MAQSVEHLSYKETDFSILSEFKVDAVHELSMSWVWRADQFKRDSDALAVLVGHQEGYLRPRILHDSVLYLVFNLSNLISSI